MANVWLTDTTDAVDAQIAYGALLFTTGNADAKHHYLAGRSEPAVIAWARAVGAPLD